MKQKFHVGIKFTYSSVVFEGQGSLMFLSPQTITKKWVIVRKTCFEISMSINYLLQHNSVSNTETFSKNKCVVKLKSNKSINIQHYRLS